MFWITKVAVILNSLLEITGVLMLIHTLSATETKVKYPALAAFYVCMLSYISWVNLFAENQEIFVFSYIILFLYTEWQYRMPVAQGIIAVIGAIVIAGILEMLFYAPCHLLGMWHVHEIIISLIVVLAMLVSVNILRKKIPVDEIKRNVLHKEKYSLVVVIICSVVVIYTIISFSGSKNLSFSEYFYVISCAIIIVLSFYKLNQYRYEAKIRIEYSEKYGEVLQQIRERQHKFSNQLNAINALHQICETYDELVEKQREQARELHKYIMPNNVIVLKNPIVIAHVYQKICEAADHNISLETDFECDIGELSVPDIYLVEMIGTMFDNAMENIITENKGGQMYLGITRKKEAIAIEVRNEHEYIPFSEWQMFFERGYSSKGAGRGLGLFHLKKLVTKYDGDIQVENKEIDDRNYFSMSILLTY